jgi:hypothetical protein
MVPPMRGIGDEGLEITLAMIYAFGSMTKRNHG